ncbi:hypothetical protein BHE90_004778 [Fusarium euwallaceae]|uniref:Cyanovirin-N domain-containing protein n=5 Tax=Fusarium solani species complex TaxID=232080 RepID=A0A3M2SRN8_9HYPO|nr:hypothetical protein CDV36_000109 [Fusarium kuroshium]RSL83420.1 hypothetical protein CEP51_004533 [Fusarium floridanum]RSM00735.1 hypothetical protein CDV31_011660 [Fusarium ambrosium]RSM15044.1 hypothetical protein CEP52_001047 [Fusarium oligoseptatum]RTE80686.1 hypothetical protein BHE90_004778 [Fusarium euwallaceae]
MSFHESATDISVEGNILKAQLSNGEEYLEAEFDLDTVIGVTDGVLTWGGQNFSEYSEEISFDLEGDDGVPVLRATVNHEDGEQTSSDINLSEFISNNGGVFEYVG